MSDLPFDRITFSPTVMQGKACIRGMRVTVGMIVRQIDSGTTVEEMLEGYPYLKLEDILQAVQYGERFPELKKLS